MNDEIKKILDGFDKCLKNYELDKAFGQLSVESIYHLFPHKQLLLKDYITKLQEDVRTGQEINSELQQENEMMRKLIDEGVENSYKKLKYLQQENETRQQDINNLTYQLAKEKSIVEKAVDYIKNNISWYYDEDLDESIYQDVVDGDDLLNILQNGSEGND